MMAGVSRGLSDTDIANLAAYYAAQSCRPTTKRTPARAEALAKSLGGNIGVKAWDERAPCLKTANLLVNTTTLGMKGQPRLEIDLAPLPVTAVVNDIVYVPLETPLLAAARARGNTVVDGLGMLLYQAQPSFAGWFGVKPEVTSALRAHVLASMA